MFSNVFQFPTFPRDIQAGGHPDLSTDSKQGCTMGGRNARWHQFKGHAMQQH